MFDSTITLIKKVIKDSLTCANGVDYDGAKVVGYPSCALAILVFIGNAIKTMFLDGKLDYVAFGTGFATLAGAVLLVAGGVAIKNHTEPQATTPEQK